MKYIKQMAIIGGITFIGEMLNILLPLPVPGSVYGLLILLTCLFTGIVKLEQVEATAEFLITAMPVMFISPTVSITGLSGGMSSLSIVVTGVLTVIIAPLMARLM